MHTDIVHAGEAVHRARKIAWIHAQHDLGDVFRVVCDTFEFRGDLHTRDDIAQVRRNRLLEGKRSQALAFDHPQQCVDLWIALHDLLGQRRILAHETVHRRFERAAGQLCHVEDVVMNAHFLAIEDAMGICHFLKPLSDYRRLYKHRRRNDQSYPQRTPRRAEDRQLIAPVPQLDLPRKPFRLLQTNHFKLEFHAPALRRQVLLGQLQFEVALPSFQLDQDFSDVVTRRRASRRSEGQAPLNSAEECFQAHDLCQMSVIYLESSQTRHAET